MDNKQSVGTLSGQISLVIWSFSAVLMMFVKNLPTFEILSITFVLSFLMSTIVITIRKEWSQIKHPLTLWIAGIVGTFGNDALYTEAFKHAPATHIDLINFLWPILVVIFSAFIPGEKFNIRHLVAGFLGFFSIYMLTTNGHGILGFDFRYMTGYLLAFADALTWCLFVIVARRHKSVPFTMIGLYCGINAILSLICHFSFEVTVIPNSTEWMTLIILGLASQGIAYYFWDFGVKQGDFILLSIISYATPILSILFLILFGFAKFTFILISSTFIIAIAGLIGSQKWENYFSYFAEQKAKQTNKLLF